MSALTGRLAEPPADLLLHEILEPQFRFEAASLLDGYVHAEKALLVEARRLRLVTPEATARIAAVLHRLTPDELSADPGANAADLAFAIERHVLAGLADIAPAWRADRSRNDLQAAAHLLYLRTGVLDLADRLLRLAAAAHDLAARGIDQVMPGYTHGQAAQAISPGFAFAAIGEQILRTGRALLYRYDEGNLSPLGAGAMAGQEQPWDRAELADLLGCAGPCPHALVAVAGRGWPLEVTAELSLFGLVLGRHITDLMTWTGAGHGFFELPDRLSGISSAMPQKKNYVVLERIRGRTAHLSSLHLSIVLAQRGTAFANSVEVGKEAMAFMPQALATARSVLALTEAVFNNLTPVPERMAAAARTEFLGAFSLANRMTLTAGIPWRPAQVIVGRYIVAAMARGLAPDTADPALLAEAADAEGYPLPDPSALLAGVFEAEANLLSRATSGSTHPDAVRALLADQQREAARQRELWADRRAQVTDAMARTDAALGLVPDDRKETR
ncbi:lyase family protein [Amycolatopsis keratiniphila]|uniref:argininosuccinate lyase n=1 Tax=Amycolatopsis keratiniphila TaxID=129921 RepID=R4TAS1_9PSEU|nr:lyase family protein [Amycolatopsis keratiniphila]AGM07907.1 argininosuccinate lyase [Amycolatopsis keratiniphila]